MQCTEQSVLKVHCTVHTVKIHCIALCVCVGIKNVIFFFFNAIVSAFKFAFFSETPGGSFAVFFSFGSKLKHFPRTIGGGIGFGGHVVLNGLFMLVSFRKMMMVMMVTMMMMVIGHAGDGGDDDVGHGGHVGDDVITIRQGPVVHVVESAVVLGASGGAEVQVGPGREDEDEDHVDDVDHPSIHMIDMMLKTCTRTHFQSHTPFGKLPRCSPSAPDN